MHYIVNVDHNSMAEVIVKGFCKYCVSSAVDETVLICCGMVVKRVWMLGVSVG